jgi:hypothetical protein
MVDWIVLLFLAAVAVALNSIEPFHRFVGKDTMDSSLLYPLKGNTVPIWAVAVLAVVAPVLIFAGIYVRRRNAYDLHHAVLGLLFSVLITAVVTEAIKNGVGRPRPDFYWRCFPDGVPVSFFRPCFFLSVDIICRTKFSLSLLLRITTITPDKSYATGIPA